MYKFFLNKKKNTKLKKTNQYFAIHQNEIKLEKNKLENYLELFGPQKTPYPAAARGVFKYDPST